MLVLDEAHKLRNLYGVENPPQVATRFRKALEERRFRFVLCSLRRQFKTVFGISIHWSTFSLLLEDIRILSVARACSPASSLRITESRPGS